MWYPTPKAMDVWGFGIPGEMIVALLIKDRKRVLSGHTRVLENGLWLMHIYGAEDDALDPVAKLGPREGDTVSILGTQPPYAYEAVWQNNKPIMEPFVFDPDFQGW